jgi:hypothetical protein
MHKNISIIRGNKEESYISFHQRIKLLIEEIKAIGVARLHFTITLQKPPGLSVIPFSKAKIAMISVQNKDHGYHEILEKQEGYAGSFAVTEALPVAYDKNWGDGLATPGVCLLTLFRQKKGQDYDVFIDRWHNGHTPHTLKVHPIYHYNRNVVNKAIGDPPVWYDGIVEEHCRDRKTLLNPFIFFGKPLMAPINMVKTYFDVKSFIDYGSIETYLVREYHIIS